MAVLNALISVISRINDAVFWAARQLAWMIMAAMVIIIFLQVVFRLISPLSWSEQAAISLMVWMTGLVAPSAYRWGGFVAIDMLREALPRFARFILTLTLFGISLIVLVAAVRLGFFHVTVDGKWMNIPLKIQQRWIYVALLIGFAMMISANIELILKEIRTFLDPSYKDDASHQTARLTAE